MKMKLNEKKSPPHDIVQFEHLRPYRELRVVIIIAGVQLVGLVR